MNYMKKFILIVTALMMVTLTYAQQDMRSIQVIGRASISALPQEFSFSVPIEVKNMNYDQCYNELVTKMDLLNKDLKKAGYGDQQVKVQNLSVRENYTWEQSKRIFQGYIGSVSVTIKGAYTTSQLNTVLKVLKQHECLYSLSFNLSELQREDLRKQAIHAAVKNALANAQQLPSSISVQLG